MADNGTVVLVAEYYDLQKKKLPRYLQDMVADLSQSHYKIVSKVSGNITTKVAASVLKEVRKLRAVVLVVIDMDAFLASVDATELIRGLKEVFPRAKILAFSSCWFYREVAKDAGADNVARIDDVWQAAVEDLLK